MKLLFCADIHLAERPPAARSQTYSDDIFAKLEEVKEIAAKCDITVMGGDLFHQAIRPPHSLVRRTIECLREWPNPMYIVVGNHDLPPEGMAGLNRTALGVVLEGLRGNSMVHLLHEDTVFIGPENDTVQLSPGHWTPTIDTDPSALMMGECRFKPLTQPVKIKVVHAMVCVGGGERPFPYIDATKAATDADIVLCAHTHWQTGPYPRDGTLFVGPGSIARTQAKEDELKRQVQVAILNTYESTVELVPLKSAKPSAEVFTEIAEKTGEARDERFNGYVAALESGLVLGADTVEEAMTEMSKRAPIGVAERAIEYLKAAGG